MGFRDIDRNPAKSTHVHRILLFGDSLVFGWGVPQNRRFSDIGEKKKQSVELWNMAVPGYGLDQEILSYEKTTQVLNATEIIFFVSEATLQRTHFDYLYKKDSLNKL